LLGRLPAAQQRQGPLGHFESFHHGRHYGVLNHWFQ
jgi:hypothetical protein